MISRVSYFKVGRIDEIVNAGWVRVTLLGWDIVVLFYNNEFIAIERGGFSGVGGAGQKTYLPNKTGYSKSGSPSVIDKFMSGPDGNFWGRLRQFPVRIEDDFVFVGVIQ